MALRDPLGLKEFFGRMALNAYDSNGDDINLLAEDDGTLRQQVVLWDDILGQPIRQNAETDGEARVSLVGLDSGSAITNWLFESTGEAHVVLNGDTGGGTIGPLEINPIEITLASEGQPVHQDGALVPTAQTTVYTVPASTLAIFEVELNTLNAGNVDVDVWIVESGGTAVDANRRITDKTLRNNDGPARFGPYFLETGGTVVVQADLANRANVQLILRERSV